MKKLFALLILLILFSFQGCDEIEGVNKNNYYSKILEIYEYEANNPLEFLTLSGSFSESFWEDKFNLESKITNRAKIAFFKDVVIKITYLSKTNSVIATENYTLYEYFPAQREKEIKFSIKNYKDVNSFQWLIVSATPTQNN